jgi:TolB-like protein
VNFLGELKRRNVFRVGIAYLLGAWVLLQIADFILDVIGAPTWALQALVMVAVIGMPVVLTFAWVFEITPEGIKRESEIDRNDSIAPQTGRKLDRAIIIFLAAAVLVLLADRFMGSGSMPPEITRAAVPIEQKDLNLTPAATPPAEPVPEQDTPSIAVLPFVNMSSDPEQEYFSDGLAEELLNRLAKIENLRVAARTSSFQFKGQNLDMADIGRQLKVANVLEGSVRKAGNRVRITAQLINTENGYHLWSENYEREMDDIFGIQDEISGAITQALKLELGMQEEQGPPTNNLEAYQLFLQARFLLAKRGWDNMFASIELFEQALTLDPGFARAWSGLAFTWSLMPSYGAVETELARSKVNEYSARALTLDVENSEPYLALGRIQSSFDGAILEAQANFEKAYALAPNDVDVVNLYGDFLFLAGRIDEAETMERRAVDMDPLAAVHYSDLAFVLMIRRKLDEAIAFARTGKQLAEDVIDRQDPLVFALVRAGRFEEAKELIDHIEQSPMATPMYVNAWRCALYYEQGDLDNLRATLAERLVLGEEVSGLSAYVVAAWYTLWLDGPEAALPLLEKGRVKEEYQLTWPEYFILPEMVSDDAAFLAFWEHPRLRELMEVRRANWSGEKLGYWKEREPPSP